MKTLSERASKWVGSKEIQTSAPIEVIEFSRYLCVKAWLAGYKAGKKEGIELEKVLRNRPRGDTWNP